MFIQSSQNVQPIPQNPFQTKRQNFRSEIRLHHLNKLLQKARQRLFFGNEVNYKMLQGINLKQTMKFILKYQYPKDMDQNNEFNLDEQTKIYDLERPQNEKLAKEIQNLFLYMTSSMYEHALNLVEERHIFKMAEILQRKIIDMKPNFPQKSKQGKHSDTQSLPKVYEQVLTILTHWSYDQCLFFDDSIKCLIDLFNQTLKVFSTHTKVVKCCFYSLSNSLDTPGVVEYILFLMNKSEPQNCIITRFIEVSLLKSKVFEHQVNLYDCNSYHSLQIVNSALRLLERIFTQVKSSQLSPKMRRRMGDQLASLLQIEDLSSEATCLISNSLISLYNPELGPIQTIILETQRLFSVVLLKLETLIEQIQTKSAKQKSSKLQSIINIFSTLKSIFNSVEPSYEHYEELLQFLKQEVNQSLDFLLQKAIKSKQNLIVFHTLELIKCLCLWGDFIEIIYGDIPIVIKLFHYSANHNFKFKKQAIESIFNIIEGYFDSKNYFDPGLCDIYQTVIERYDFLDILIQNLDSYYDVELNIAMLQTIRILCEFWRSVPELERQNKFWIKFTQNGGQLKLNTIISQQRNENMKQLALAILNGNFIRQFDI